MKNAFWCSRNMMAMCGARLRQLTSRTISTLLFEGRTGCATCNAGMMVVNSFFLIIVEMKQLGLVTWFMTFKEVHDLQGGS